MRNKYLGSKTRNNSTEYTNLINRKTSDLLRKVTMNKISLQFLTISLLAFGLILIYSCSDNSGTDKPLPQIITTEVSNVTRTTAQSGGEIISDGESSVTSRGVCWSTSPSPTISNDKTVDGAGSGAFISEVTGLSPNLDYFIRAYATNANGTSYGTSYSFKTLDEVTDIDGNAYGVTKIGTQTWITENLKTTKYRNGDVIPNVVNNEDWIVRTTNAWTYYNNDASNNTDYGKLYNWYAITDSRKICPTGWHVPTNDEWLTLANYLGGESIAGGKLKEAGLTHWISPNIDATNEFAFNALPGGQRVGGFSDFGNLSTFATSSSDGEYGIFKDIYNTGPKLGTYIDVKWAGVSCRCIKD